MPWRQLFPGLTKRGCRQREKEHLPETAYTAHGEPLGPHEQTVPQIQICSSSSNCHFLSCIQASQETGQVAWYSRLFKNFPQFVVIHTVKGFGVVNEADFFFFFYFFFYDPVDVSNLISGSSAFSKSSLYIWKFSVHILLKPSRRILRINLLACEMSTTVW